jgi:copper resistance protein B
LPEIKMPPLKLALLAGAAAFVLASPAAAQMNMNMPGMHMPGMKMPPPQKKAAPPKKPSAKKKAAKKPAAKAAAKKAGAKKPAATKPSAKKPASAHEGHDMSTIPGMKMPPAGATQGPTPGHDMSTMPGMTMPPGQPMQTMPGMAMPGMEAGTEATGTNLPAGNAPPPPVPTDHAADAVYGTPAMEMGRHHLDTFHGGQKLFQVFNNVMEYQARKGRDGYEWNSEAWYGGDINRAWLKSEGDGTFGRSLDRAEVQALYSHAIDP